MKKEKINGIEYKLPDALNSFQKKMYVHLINWKWDHITTEPGRYKHDGKAICYDAILPESVHKNIPLVYHTVLSDLTQHQKKLPFKLHHHFNHMASSQAANINLFIPILLHPKADEILKHLKPDFHSLATKYLYKGFRIEFWDGNSYDEKGLLCDHSTQSGTDSDIAIAYYNKETELCLWLIEHKLTEKEFTECGGFKSKNRKKLKYQCDLTFSQILMKKQLCYYHDIRKFKYWQITEENKLFFLNADKYTSCPFKGGMNQLWRNQLMGLALENSGKYKHVYFSVVRHHDNTALEKSINEYKKLINNNPKFFVFTSRDVVDVVRPINNSILNEWVDWYCKLYSVESIKDNPNR